MREKNPAAKPGIELMRMQAGLANPNRAAQQRGQDAARSQPKYEGLDCSSHILCYDNLHFRSWYVYDKKKTDDDTICLLKNRSSHVVTETGTT